MRGNKKNLILLAVIGGIFIAGVVHLFVLRFEAGDFYPAYSSLRSDPLGAMALYESLENLDGINVARNHLPLKKVSDVSGSTILYLGASENDLWYLNEDMYKIIERYVASGARMVFSFLPHKGGKSDSQNSETTWEPEKEKYGKDSEDKDAGQESEQKKENGENEKDGDIIPFSLEEKLGIVFRHDTSERNKALPVNSRQFGGRPVSWHSDLWFEDQDQKWRVLYTRDGYPVIIEKNIGRGSIALSADSYYLSNEALRDGPHSKLIARIIGGNGRVVFDEYHHGIQKNPGIAGLARKYHLHGIFFGIIVLSILFVWKNSVWFVPPMDDGHEETNNLVFEKDNISGLVSLIRHNTQTRDILKLCIGEWKNSRPYLGAIPKKKVNEMKKMESLVANDGGRFANPDDIVNGYNRICKILSRKELM